MTPTIRASSRGTRTGRTSGAPTSSDAELARLAKALGHPARVAILRRLLSQGECVCGEIVEGLPLAQATVSQHLKVLKEAGLIKGEIDGPRVCYCVAPRMLRRLKALAGSL
jgi:ArsR family transcriptional regulator